MVNLFVRCFQNNNLRVPEWFLLSGKTVYVHFYSTGRQRLWVLLWIWSSVSIQCRQMLAGTLQGVLYLLDSSKLSKTWVALSNGYSIKVSNDPLLWEDFKKWRKDGGKTEGGSGAHLILGLEVLSERIFRLSLKIIYTDTLVAPF